ncbi:MAG: rubrerythrin [Ruminococcaceae bacterium]|nr:rubrerythrin [Oscillospiraceae bacterium]
MTMSATDRKTLLKSQQGELDAVLMYNALADVVRDAEDAETFRVLAAEEGRHAAVFKGLTQQILTPKKTKAVLLPLLYKAIGKKRLYPLIAKGEYSAESAYAPVAEKYPEVQSVKADEKRHGDTVLALLRKDGGNASPAKAIIAGTGIALAAAAILCLKNLGKRPR